MLLVAIVWLESATGPVLFTDPPDLSELDPTSLRVIFALFIIGVGMKAAIVPLHGWLPSAMAATAPVSALLHAVAVVKAGAFGVIRVVYDVFGVEQMAALGVGTPLAILASVSVIWGSLKALQQTEIKKRLAFSTVSQVSYIILGAALVSPFGLVGGLAHLVHQGLMKITLFFCAGIYDERAGVRAIEGLNGLGPRMPWTSTCFSLAALGMIGLPPIAGFVTKIYLGLGGLQGGGAVGAGGAGDFDAAQRGLFPADAVPALVRCAGLRRPRRRKGPGAGDPRGRRSSGRLARVRWPPRSSALSAGPR